jgi:PAS domain S-box-containing protein
MLGFRKKIVLSHAALVAFLIGLLFPLVALMERMQMGLGAGVLGVTIPLLILSSLLQTVIIQKILRPVQQIIERIKPYREGKEEFLPRLAIGKEDEFGTLASTLNSLSDRIQNQIGRLTRQKKETEDILESINEGIVATDTSAKVTFINQVACRMLGVSREEILDQTLASLKASDLPKRCHELALYALQTAEPLMETWNLRETGTHLTLISAPLTHQNGSLLVLQDKTSDYKVIELGKDFIANASHELRTPITIIRGFAETLQDLPTLSQDMLQQITEKIVRTCGRLDKLVRSLITLADAENLSEGRLKATDLIAVVENCKHLFLSAHPQARLSITCHLQTASIFADADLCELAILNLLENALKYSQDRAKIEMTVDQGDKEFLLTVRDQGIGISEADLPRIFDRFFTVDKARSRKSGGAGLGLSIVKTIIEKHRGRVIATSAPSQGSAFTLTLPQQK